MLAQGNSRFMHGHCEGAPVVLLQILSCSIFYVLQSEISILPHSQTKKQRTHENVLMQSDYAHAIIWPVTHSLGRSRSSSFSPLFLLFLSLSFSLSPFFLSFVVKYLKIALSSV
jgi:hypothetical protein